MAFHPAASPFVQINYDTISYLSLVTTERGANAIYLRRLTKKFSDLAELEQFMADGNNNLKDKDRIVYD